MRKLSRSVALKTARSATAAGARVIKKAAVANIEKSPSIETGSLHDSVIVKRLGKNESSLTSEHIVTVRGRGKVVKKGKNKGQRQTSAPHAHLVEFGTVNMPAEPFLGPAFTQHKEAAVTAIKDKLAQRIAKVKP
ncbi:MAG: HK97 gp10 family phage protein [Betaproteobacteria bacterium]|nr:HK97 gp10 family phage protein [Betaproteobacteria bacterium]